MLCFGTMENTCLALDLANFHLLCYNYVSRMKHVDFDAGNSRRRCDMQTERLFLWTTHKMRMCSAGKFQITIPLISVVYYPGYAERVVGMLSPCARCLARAVRPRYSTPAVREARLDIEHGRTAPLQTGLGLPRPSPSTSTGRSPLRPSAVVPLRVAIHDPVDTSSFQPPAVPRESPETLAWTVRYIFLSAQ